MLFEDLIVPVKVVSELSNLIYACRDIITRVFFSHYTFLYHHAFLLSFASSLEFENGKNKMPI